MATFADPTLQCLSAMSVVLDLANGLAEEKSLLSAVFALELAVANGCEEPERLDAFYAALVRHLGCTAFASVESTMAGDDQRFRQRLITGDSARIASVVGALLDANDGLLDRGAGLVQLLRQRSTLRANWTQEACQAGQMLSTELGLGPGVGRALEEVYERYDGEGSPRATAGDALALAGRIAHVAHVAVVFYLAGGTTLANEVLQARSGTMLDPKLVKHARGLLKAFDAAGDGYVTERAGQVDALVNARRPTATLEDVARAFGDFADLQSPFTRGHSRLVAQLVSKAGAALGLPAESVRETVLAAHLHDLGQVAVPTAIWLRPRALRAGEQERMGSHVYFTERALALAAPFEGVAKIAAGHHERLDGSGYHRGQAAVGLSRPARLLAVADVAAALMADRPHRKAFDSAGVAKELRAQVKQGRLDESCVDAVLGVLGSRRNPDRPSVPVETLTERELEVLRHLAGGLTNKEIAQALDISARTVQQHTLHIYAKLGINTRAGAALIAVRTGLI